MKALTIHEPFAWAIAAGYKPVENRTWTTKHRGALAIHASKQKPDPDDIDFVTDCAFGRPGIDITQERWDKHRAEVVAALRPGCVLAVAMVDRMIDSADSLPSVLREWFCGPFGWLFDADVRRIADPIPAKGAQGLWGLDPATEEAVCEAIS